MRRKIPYSYDLGFASSHRLNKRSDLYSYVLYAVPTVCLVGTGSMEDMLDALIHTHTKKIPTNQLSRNMPRSLCVEPLDWFLCMCKLKKLVNNHQLTCFFNARGKNRSSPSTSFSSEPGSCVAVKEENDGQKEEQNRLQQQQRQHRTKQHQSADKI